MAPHSLQLQDQTQQQHLHTPHTLQSAAASLSANHHERNYIFAMDHGTSETPGAEVNYAGGSAPPSEASVRTKIEIGSPEYWAILKRNAAEGERKYKWMFDNRPPNGVFSSVEEYCRNPVMAMLRRDGRKNTAKYFRGQYIYGIATDGCPNPLVGIREKRSCIWSKDARAWLEKSSGIIWVGVHGTDSVCVVTLREDLDWKRVRGSFLNGFTKQSILTRFRISIISDIEDLVDPSSEVRKWISCSIEKPLGVVCVLPKIRLGSEPEAPSFGYDDKKAIKFLKDKMANETSFTITETIQTAISAFQHLFDKKLEANDIGVSVMDPRYRVPVTDKSNKDPTVRELEMSEIEKYLAAIHEPSPGEIGEHSGVADEPSPPLKRKRTSLVQGTQIPALGGSTFPSEIMED